MRVEPVSVRTTYERWADTYPAVAHNPLMRLEQDVVESILATVRPSRALDVGTGSGRYLPVLLRAGAASVVGVDFSMAMLRRCNSAPIVGADPRVRPTADTWAGCGKVVCADARRLPFRRRSFDVINASLMVGDIVDLHAWTHEMARALARGGHLVYSDFHPAWAEHGWKRTFRSRDGQAHDVGFAAHGIDDHLAALASAGLRAVAIREPRFSTDSDSDPDVRMFRRRWRNPPVVVVFHAIHDL